MLAGNDFKGKATIPFFGIAGVCLLLASIVLRMIHHELFEGEVMPTIGIPRVLATVLGFVFLGIACFKTSKVHHAGGYIGLGIVSLGCAIVLGLVEYHETYFGRSYIVTPNIQVFGVDPSALSFFLTQLAYIAWVLYFGLLQVKRVQENPPLQNSTIFLSIVVAIRAVSLVLFTFLDPFEHASDYEIFYYATGIFAVFFAIDLFIWFSKQKEFPATSKETSSSGNA